MNTALLVGVGGFCGAISRVWVSKRINRRFESAFPLGTLVVNLFGAFLLGIVITSHSLHSWKLLLGTGYMGAFTTFSTFKLENIKLYQQKHHAISLWYLGISYVGGVMFAFVGMIIGQQSF